MEPLVQLTDGTIAQSALGRTLIHEHVLIGMPGWNLDPKAPKFIRAEALSRAVDRLQELRHYQCQTIVDPCPMDLCRDVEFVAEAAQRSGVNIVCATGVYSEGAGIPYTFRSMPRQDIIELYLKELTDGVGETGIRAGVVKIATGEGPATEYEQKMIGVAAEVARMTGVPLISHTHAVHGHQQVDLVEQHGSRADCLVVGHSGDRDDSPYQVSLAERGAFVGLDRFGMEDMFLSDELRIKNLLQLVEAGHRDNILISHDNAICFLGRVALEFERLMPKWSVTHIFQRILPRLVELGLPPADIDAILIDNPRRLFANAAAQRPGNPSTSIKANG
jgi:phosphotriesterase-related protein